MANPCLNPKASDFRGYPNNTVKDYWKTTAINPCTINVNTLIKEPLFYDYLTDKYYVAATGEFADGKYFSNSKGNGIYIVIVAGTIQSNTIESLNYSCNRDYTGYVQYADIKPKITSQDTYGDYIFCVYSTLNIVVRYPNNHENGNPTGLVVAGNIGQQDLGRGTPLEEPLLSAPTYIKCCHASNRFVVYSNGMHKSFKVFDINGNFLYKFRDSVSQSSSSNLEYQTPGANEVGYIPMNPNGLVGLLGAKHFGDTESAMTQTVANLWHVVAMDFIRIGSADIVFVGLWRFSKTGNVNSFMIMSLSQIVGATSGLNCRVNTLYSLPSFSQRQNEIIPGFSVSRVNSVSGEATSRWINIAVVIPRAFEETTTVGWMFSDLREVRWKYYLTGNNPNYNNNTNRKVSLVPFDLGLTPLRENVVAEVRRGFNGEIAVLAICSHIKRSDIILEYLVHVLATGGTAATLLAIGLQLQGASEWFPIWNNAFGIKDFEITGAGLTFTIVALAITWWVYKETKPDPRLIYSVFYLIPDSSTPTVYNYEFAHSLKSFVSGNSMNHILFAYHPNGGAYNCLSVNCGKNELKIGYSLISTSSAFLTSDVNSIYVPAIHSISRGNLMGSGGWKIILNKVENRNW